MNCFVKRKYAFQYFTGNILKNIDGLLLIKKVTTEPIVITPCPWEKYMAPTEMSLTHHDDDLYSRPVNVEYLVFVEGKEIKH